MIVSNQQKDVDYFKQYPCYSLATHLSHHRQLEFANATYVHFSHNTFPKQQLPKYFIDKYQSPHQMYWLEWTVEDVPQSVLQQGQLRVTTNRNILSNSNLSSQSSHQDIPQKYRCLYIAALGQIAHIKLVFNSDPEFVGICQDFLYTIGGNQLIVTQLWPQTVNSTQNLQSSSEIPPKQSQIIHQLNQASTVFSLDFVYDEAEGVICKVVYFHQKKGIYSQVYGRNQAIETSLINKLFDFSLKFKKNQPQPLFYKTLVPNILGIVIHNTTQFSLFNLTEMKPIERTRTTLQGWQLNPNQPFIVKSTVNKALADYNDCLNIVIGQGENIEIFLYHLCYSQSAIITCQRDNEKKRASELKNYPIHMFTSGEFIDFERSKLNHFTLIHLEKITHLENFILNTDGIIYLGYQKSGSNDESLISDEIPISGFIYYEKPYITHEILMQENKIWKEYKNDILRGSSEQKANADSRTLQRFLMPGRYEKQFIQRTLKLEKISDLSSYLQLNKEESLTDIHQHLVFEWRNQYKFVEFVIYKSQILIIRKNSIGTLILIEQEQFLQEKDSLAEQQVSYNEILTRGFSVYFDLEGDRYIDEEFRMYRHRNGEEEKMGMLACTGKSYEDKLRSINVILQNIGDQSIWRQDRMGGNMPYFDEQEIQKHSTKYRNAKDKIIHLSTEHDIETLPDHTTKYTEQSMISAINETQPTNPEQNYIELHISILSLRVKDVLSDLLTTMKINYPSYFSHLTSYKNKHVLSLQNLQILHLQHMYLVFVIEWILNVATKYHLQDQYQILDHDLIEEFVAEYIKQFYSKTSAQHKIAKFFKEDLQFHVRNVLALMFRGLLKDILPHSDHLKMDNFLLNNVLDPEELPQQDLTKLQIEKINRNSNAFLLMLLKRNQFNHSQSRFITDDLIRLLFNPLIFKPFNPNIEKFIPINKTFVYSILNMPLSNEEKKRILACHMEKKEFLSLLLLIQLENNCYLSLDEGLQVEIYQSNTQYFKSNTIRLSTQNCCIIEDLILSHYKLFLFPTESQANKLVQQSVKSAISQGEFEKQVVVYNQNQCIKFIKNLFSNIEFRYLTAVLMHDKKSLHGGNQYFENHSSVYENKGIAETYRQLIDEVDLINETYGCSKDSKIDRAFKKFYHKIYQQRPKQQSNAFMRDIPANQTYPEMTGLGYKLSQWELDIIEKLYKKHVKILRMQKKDTFESISIIQQRLNLEYALIKIYLFRIKLIIKEMPSFIEQQRQAYAQIMKICVQGLIGSLDLFKKWRADLSSEDKDSISDEQLLQTLSEIDQMQNSRVWDKNCDELSSYETSDEKDQQDWKILDLPITSKWLKLLELTFIKQSPSNGYAQNMFTNYNSIEDVLMKILIVIKSQSLQKEAKQLRELFGSDRINSVISRNKQLNEIYNQRSQPRRYQSQNTYGYQRNLGLLSNGTFNQNYTSKTSFN